MFKASLPAHNSDYVRYAGGMSDSDSIKDQVDRLAAAMIGTCHNAEGTTAIPTSLIVDQSAGVRRSLCPACVGGRLHPHKVEVNLGGFQGYSSAFGWVAVCVGADPAVDGSEQRIEPCGFSLPVTPRPVLP